MICWNLNLRMKQRKQPRKSHQGSGLLVSGSGSGEVERTPDWLHLVFMIVCECANWETSHNVPECNVNASSILYLLYLLINVAIGLFEGIVSSIFHLSAPAAVVCDKSGPGCHNYSRWVQNSCYNVKTPLWCSECTKLHSIPWWHWSSFINHDFIVSSN